MIASLEFASPLFAAGFGLLALPVLAHLLRSHSRRSLAFPSLSLLAESVGWQTELQRVRRRVLLALRLLAMACLVLAFLQPVWRRGEAATSGGTEGTAVVLLIDVSPSTGQMADGVRLLDWLKVQAGRVLDELEPGGDVAGIVVVDGHPRSLFPRLSGNLQGLREELRKIEVGDERADVAAGVRESETLLASHPGARRLILFSDLQRTNWLEAVNGTLELPDRTVVTVISPPAGKAGNLALHAIDGDETPASASAIPGITARVLVANEAEAEREVRVRCGRLPWDPEGAVLEEAEATLSLGPGERREATFRFDAQTPQQSLLRFSVDADDDLGIDNEAWLRFGPRPSHRAVVVDDSADEPGTSAYFLLRALSPQRGGTGRFEARQVRSEQLSPQTLAAADVIVVGRLEGLGDDQAAALRERLRAGAGLIWFAGMGDLPRQLRALESPALAGTILSWPLDERRESPPNQPRRIRTGGWLSHWLREFDEQSRLALERVRFTSTWTAGPMPPETEVLLRFDDGAPALGARPVGHGQFLLAGFSPEPETGDLARQGVFVALLQMLAIESMADQPERRQSFAGDVVHFSLPAEARETLAILDPRGTSLAGIPTGTSREGYMSRDPLHAAGVYRLMDNGKVLDIRVVALDPRESDLRRMDAVGIERAFSTAGVAAETVTAAGSETLINGRPLWGLCLWGATLALAVELALLAVWRR